MRKSTEIIRAVKAREAAEKDRQRKPAAPQSVPSASVPHTTSASTARHRAKRSLSFTGFCFKVILAIILVFATIYGANEAMQFLLK